MHRSYVFLALTHYVPRFNICYGYQQCISITGKCIKVMRRITMCVYTISKHPNYSHRIWQYSVLSKTKKSVGKAHWSTLELIYHTGIILCMHPANENWCYIVTSSLIGWAHTQNDPWSQSSRHRKNLQKYLSTMPNLRTNFSLFLNMIFIAHITDMSYI